MNKEQLKQDMENQLTNEMFLHCWGLVREKMADMDIEFTDEEWENDRFKLLFIFASVTATMATEQAMLLDALGAIMNGAAEEKEGIPFPMPEPVHLL